MKHWIKKMNLNKGFYEIIQPQQFIIRHKRNFRFIKLNTLEKGLNKDHHIFYHYHKYSNKFNLTGLDLDGKNFDDIQQTSHNIIKYLKPEKYILINSGNGQHIIFEHEFQEGDPMKWQEHNCSSFHKKLLKQLTPLSINETEISYKPYLRLPGTYNIKRGDKKICQVIEIKWNNSQ